MCKIGLNSEGGTVLSILEVQRRSRLDKPRGGLETLYPEAPGRGELPAQLPGQHRYLLLQGLHCKSVESYQSFSSHSPHFSQFEYELACNEVLGWKRRSTTVEGFTKEVNTFCDPSAFSVIHNIVQDKYRALPCSIM